MKNIYEIMKEFGLEVPEEKKAEFEKAWKENYRTKADYDKVVEQRDNYKSQYDTASGELEKFKDVKPDELQATIQKLQDDLKAKDDEYAAKEAERIFSDTLKSAIREAGGRNEKAVIGLLDVDSLKGSKDQTEDIKKALEAIKESDAYLFGADEPIKNPVGPTGGTAPSIYAQQGKCRNHAAFSTLKTIKHPL